MKKATAQKNTLLKNAQATAEGNFFKRVFFYPPEKNYFLKFPSLLKNLKTATHSRHKTNPTMTAKLTADIDFTTSTDRRPAYNSGLAKVAVQCFVGQFCGYINIVLRMKFCG